MRLDFNIVISKDVTIFRFFSRKIENYMQLHTEITLIANVRFYVKTCIGGIYMDFGKKSKALSPGALEPKGARPI